MSSQLFHTVRISKQIRQVIEASHQLNYVALNALLISHKAGARSSGFAVVARELRTLAHDLEKLMHQLDTVIDHLVGSVATLIGGTHQLNYMRMAATACAIPPVGMSRTLARAQQRAAERQALTERHREVLSQHFTRAVRLSDLGRALSRNAKVEAVHGGTMAESLKLVAEQIDVNVNHVTGRLRELRILIHP